MKAYHMALLLVGSAILLDGCAVDSVGPGPAYRDVYSPVYGSYPSYDWGSQSDYYPSYEPVGYYPRKSSRL
jgi:hypothetical protein